VLTVRRALVLWLIIVGVTSAVLLVSIGVGWQALPAATRQLALTGIGAAVALGAIAALQAWVSRQASRDGQGDAGRPSDAAPGDGSRVG
jgi:hypothetical protein